MRRARVRNRLLAGVALCAAAVLAAGAPGVVDLWSDVSESQDLVEQGDLNQRAMALSHALADERDTLMQYAAEDRTGAVGGVTDSQSARVDRQAAELRSQVPADIRRRLDLIDGSRRRALAGRSTALEVHAAYTEILQALDRIAADTARSLPARSEGPSAQALPDLAHAVEQASSTRGLLLAGLTASGQQQSQLIAAAQQARVREQAALADFDQTAAETDRDHYTETVNGHDVALAERYLLRLVDQPILDQYGQVLNRDRVAAGLSTRIELMRGVVSALSAAETDRLEQLRDDDVTALEIRIALLGACLLLTVGAGVAAARSMTRPLAVLRLGSRRVAGDPVGEEPVKYTGRNDEFADVVRAVNELRAAAAELHERAIDAEAGKERPADTGDRLSSEHQHLTCEHETVVQRLTAMQSKVHGGFVNLTLRTLGLVERQLSIIEMLENGDTDPEQLATLYKLDHMATRMRRHSENLLLLAGAEHAVGHRGPVPLIDVLRAAISEIERYERVELASLPAHVQVSGFAADDISHLVAELLDNATAFSPPDVLVQLTGWLMENGEVMLSVQDEGIGMTSERLSELNRRLDEPGKQEPPSPESGEALGMGLYVVARLSARHGVRVGLRAQKQGGTAAVVVLPRTLLPDRPAPGGVGPAGATTSVTGTVAGLPGSVAEANSNALPGRPAHGRRVPGTPDRVSSVSGASAASAASAVSESSTASAASVTSTASAISETSVASAASVTSAASVISETSVTAVPAVTSVASAASASALDAEPAAEAPPVPPSGPLDLTDDPIVAAAERAVRDAGERAVSPPDEHVRPTEEDGFPGPGEPVEPAGSHGTTEPRAPGEPAAPARPAAERRPLTDKGLPKRTPKTVDTGKFEQPGGDGVNAEELRQRLGGFQRGARDGHRDAASEATQAATEAAEARTEAAKARTEAAEAAGAAAEGVAEAAAEAAEGEGRGARNPVAGGTANRSRA